MIDCTAYRSVSPLLPNGLYRIKLPVIGHVTAVCAMDIDGGGWTVSFLKMMYLISQRMIYKHNYKKSNLMR